MTYLEKELTKVVDLLTEIKEGQDEQLKVLDEINDKLDEVSDAVFSENDMASILFDELLHSDGEEDDEDILVEDEDDFEEEEKSECSSCDDEDCEYRDAPYEEDDEDFEEEDDEEESENVLDYNASLDELAEKLTSLLKALVE